MRKTTGKGLLVLFERRTVFGTAASRAYLLYFAPTVPDTGGLTHWQSRLPSIARLPPSFLRPIYASLPLDCGYRCKFVFLQSKRIFTFLNFSRIRKNPPFICHETFTNLAVGFSAIIGIYAIDRMRFVVSYYVFRSNKSALLVKHYLTEGRFEGARHGRVNTEDALSRNSM